MPSRLNAFQAQLFHALAHPMRIAIVEALRDGEVNATVLPGRLRVDASQLAAHLTFLGSQRIVTHQTRGHHTYVALTERLALDLVELTRPACRARMEESYTRLTTRGRARADADRGADSDDSA
ncbi:MAG: helix-turn-helix domain-containing protein [Vicinamibacterales bacterium]